MWYFSTLNDHHFRQQVTFNHTFIQCFILWTLSTFHPRTAECIFELNVIRLWLSLLLCANVHLHQPAPFFSTLSYSAAFAPPCFARSSFCSCRVFGWIEMLIPDVFLWKNASVRLGIDSCWNTYSRIPLASINSMSVVPPEKMGCYSCSMLMQAAPLPCTGRSDHSVVLSLNNNLEQPDLLQR